MKTPSEIQFYDKEIFIQWDDTSKSYISNYELRCQCPCAYCIDEFTGEKILKRENVDLKIKPISAERIGAYAMQIKWSDGHSTGIFTWDFLGDFSGTYH